MYCGCVPYTGQSIKSYLSNNHTSSHAWSTGEYLTLTERWSLSGCFQPLGNILNHLLSASVCMYGRFYIVQFLPLSVMFSVWSITMLFQRNVSGHSGGHYPQLDVSQHSLQSLNGGKTEITHLATYISPIHLCSRLDLLPLCTFLMSEHSSISYPHPR